MIKPITPAQRTAIEQFGMSALITGLTAGLISITSIIATPGPIVWRQILIYFGMAFLISLGHSLVAYLAPITPALSGALGGFVQAVEQHTATIKALPPPQTGQVQGPLVVIHQAGNDDTQPQVIVKPTS